MVSVNRPQLIAGLVLVLSAALICVGKGFASNNVPPSVAVVIPDTVGTWVGSAIPVDDRTFEILETKDVVVKEYSRGDEPAVLYTRVGGFGSNRAAFHPPEICYTGSDFQILDRKLTSVTVNGAERQVMRLVIAPQKNAMKEYEVWYWFTANSRMTPNYYQQQLWLIQDLLRGKPMSGTLIRLSTPLDKKAPELSRSRMQTFLEAFEPAVNDK